MLPQQPSCTQGTCRYSQALDPAIQPTFQNQPPDMSNHINNRHTHLGVPPPCKLLDAADVHNAVVEVVDEVRHVLDLHAGGHASKKAGWLAWGSLRTAVHRHPCHSKTQR